MFARDRRHGLVANPIEHMVSECGSVFTPIAVGPIEPTPRDPALQHPIANRDWIRADAIDHSQVGSPRHRRRQVLAPEKLVLAFRTPPVTDIQEWHAFDVA
jgi:hypothetical protein